MARMTVGGRSLDLTRQEVEQRMHGHRPESIREHLVEMLETVYPPKQVLATVTGWDRTSFTTMEAQRVLTKIGFVCRRAGSDQTGQAAWTQTDGIAPESASLDERVAGLETALVVAQQAIVGLTSRLNVLESQRR